MEAMFDAHKPATAFDHDSTLQDAAFQNGPAPLVPQLALSE